MESLTDNLVEIFKSIEKTARENSPLCGICGRKAWDHDAGNCTHNHANCGCPESEIDRHWRLMNTAKVKSTAGQAMKEKLHQLKVETKDISKHSIEYYGMFANLVEDFFQISGEKVAIQNLIKQYGLIAVSHCLVGIADIKPKNPMGMLITQLRSGK
jgi:ribosomal protein L37E